MRSNIFSAFLLGTLVASTALVAGCSSEGASDDESNDAVVGGPTATAVVDVPFYFGVPKSSMNRMTADMRKKHSFPTAWNPSNNNAEVGLRVIAVENSPAGRGKMAKELATAGIIQTGDVILSFRPNLAETIPYAHIQMGTTHAGLANTASGTASTQDQPLDGEYNQPAFGAKHYQELGAFHIIRPRVFDAQFNPNAAKRRAQLEEWQNRVKTLVGTDKRPPFNGDYLTPATVFFGNDAAKLSTAIGKGLLAGNLSQFKFFCSELAYHVITLSNCTAEEIQNAGDVAQCAKEGAPFAMTGIAGAEGPEGLGEGPLLSILASKGGGTDVATLAAQVFGSPHPESSALSAGHRGANQALVALGAIDGLKALYPKRAQTPSEGLPSTLSDLMNPANAAQHKYVPPNYSPTAFLINSLKDSAHRNTDYVATVVFADANQMAVAKTLSKQPIPNTDSTTP